MHRSLTLCDETVLDGIRPQIIRMSSATDNLIENSSKTVNSGSPSVAQRTSEERLFGPGFFPSYPSNPTTRVSGLQFSWQLLVSGALVSISAFLIFLLGVSIVIQYRTMNFDNLVGVIRKTAIIVLDVAGMYALIQGNTWMLRKLGIFRVVRRRNAGNYERLSSVGNEIELENLR